MLKLKTILFIALAVTVGGVYAAWSYPTYVGTYSSNVEVPIEIEIAEAVETSVYNVEISDLKIYISCSDDSNKPQVYFDGYISVTGTLPDDLNIEDFQGTALYIQITGLKGIYQYQIADKSPVDIFNYTGKDIVFDTWFDPESRDIDRSISLGDFMAYRISINPDISLDTYEEYQTFLGCFEEDACIEMTISIE